MRVVVMMRGTVALEHDGALDRLALVNPGETVDVYLNPRSGLVGVEPGPGRFRIGRLVRLKSGYLEVDCSWDQEIEIDG